MIVASGPVVFLVFTHHKPSLAERLLCRLAETESAVSVVHHDAKSTTLPALPNNGRALFVTDPLSRPVGWPLASFFKSIGLPIFNIWPWLINAIWLHLSASSM